MLVSSRLAIEALKAIGQDRETGWAITVRALAAIAKRGADLVPDEAEARDRAKLRGTKRLHFIHV
jgi:hypothetical protein